MGKIRKCEEKGKNEVIQSEKFNMKESRDFFVSVLFYIVVLYCHMIFF